MLLQLRDHYHGVDGPNLTLQHHVQVSHEAALRAEQEFQEKLENEQRISQSLSFKLEESNEAYTTLNRYCTASRPTEDSELLASERVRHAVMYHVLTKRRLHKKCCCLIISP